MDLVRVSALTNFAQEIRETARAKLSESRDEFLATAEKYNPLNLFKSTPTGTRNEEETVTWDAPGWNYETGGYYPTEEERRIEREAIELYRQYGRFLNEQHREIYDRRWKTEDPYFNEKGRPKNPFEDLAWVNADPDDADKPPRLPWGVWLYQQVPGWMTSPPPTLVASKDFVINYIPLEISAFIIIYLIISLIRLWFRRFLKRRGIVWMEDTRRQLYISTNPTPGSFVYNMSESLQISRKKENEWRVQNGYKPLWGSKRHLQKAEAKAKQRPTRPSRDPRQQTVEDLLKDEQMWDRWWTKITRRAEICENGGYMIVPGYLLDLGYDAFFLPWEVDMKLEDTPEPPPKLIVGFESQGVEVTRTETEDRTRNEIVVEDKAQTVGMKFNAKAKVRDTTPFPHVPMATLQVAHGMQQPAGHIENARDLAKSGRMQAFLLGDYSEDAVNSAQKIVDLKIQKAAKKLAQKASPNGGENSLLPNDGASSSKKQTSVSTPLLTTIEELSAGGSVPPSTAPSSTSRSTNVYETYIHPKPRERTPHPPGQFPREPTPPVIKEMTPPPDPFSPARMETLVKAAARSAVQEQKRGIKRSREETGLTSEEAAEQRWLRRVEQYRKREEELNRMVALQTAEEDWGNTPSQPITPVKKPSSTPKVVKSKAIKRTRDQFDSSTNDAAPSRKMRKTEKGAVTTTKGLTSGAEEPPTVEDATSQEQTPSEPVIWLAEDGVTSTDKKCGGRKIGDSWKVPGHEWRYRVGAIGQRERLAKCTFVLKRTPAVHVATDPKRSEDTSREIQIAHVWMDEEEYHRAKSHQIVDSDTHDLVKPPSIVTEPKSRLLARGRDIMRNKRILGDGETDGIDHKAPEPSTLPHSSIPNRFVPEEKQRRLKGQRAQEEKEAAEKESREREQQVQLAAKERREKEKQTVEAMRLVKVPSATSDNKGTVQALAPPFKISSGPAFASTSRAKPMRTPTSALATAPVLMASWSPPSSPASSKRETQSQSNTPSRPTSSTIPPPATAFTSRPPFPFGLPTPEATFAAPESLDMVSHSASVTQSLPATQLAAASTFQQPSSGPPFSPQINLTPSVPLATSTLPVSQSPVQSLSAQISPAVFNANFAKAFASVSAATPATPTPTSLPSQSSTSGFPDVTSSQPGSSSGVGHHSIVSNPASQSSAFFSAPIHRTPIDARSAFGFGTGTPSVKASQVIPGGSHAQNPSLNGNPVTVLSAHTMQLQNNPFASGNLGTITGQETQKSGAVSEPYFKDWNNEPESEELLERRRKGLDFIEGTVPPLWLFMDGSEKPQVDTANVTKDLGATDREDDYEEVYRDSRPILSDHTYEEIDPSQLQGRPKPRPASSFDFGVPAPSFTAQLQAAGSAFPPAAAAATSSMTIPSPITDLSQRQFRTNSRITSGRAPRPAITNPVTPPPTVPQSPAPHLTTATFPAFAPFQQQQPSGSVYLSMQPSQPTGPSPFALFNDTALINQQTQNHSQRLQAEQHSRQPHAYSFDVEMQ